EPLLVAESSGERVCRMEVLPDARMIAEWEKSVPEVQVDVDGQLGLRLAFGEVADNLQRLVEVGNRLPVGGPRHGPDSGLPEIRDRLLPQLSAQGVVGETLGLLGHAFACEAFESLGNAGVKGALPVKEQLSVRDVLSESVLERVLEIGKEPSLVQELCGLKP